MADRSRLRLILNRCSPSRGLKAEDVRSALEVEPYALLDDDWAGHPLRKDYPIGGEPVRFSEAE